MQQLKTIEMIQLAHDHVRELVLSPAFDLLSEETKGKLQAQLAVLCWTLGHKAGCLFVDNLRAIVRMKNAADSATGCKEVVH